MTGASPIPRRACVTLLAALAPAMALSCSPPLPAEQPIKGLTIPVRDPAQGGAPDDGDAREDPPDADPARPFVFPGVTRARLGNGGDLVVARLTGTTQVEVSLVLPAAGHAADGDRSGLATLTAAAVTSSGAGKASAKEIAQRAAALGLSLGVSTTADATTLSFAVPKARLGEAMELLSSVLREPRLDDASVTREKRKQRAARAALARGDARWATTMLLYRELFKLPTSVHPYASADATAQEIDKLSVAEVKAFHKQRWVPSGSVLVMVGDVDAADARALSDRALASWKGADPPAQSFTAPVVADGVRIVVADLPGAPTSEIAIGTLAVDRTDEAWTALVVGTEALGGAPTTRLATTLAASTPLSHRTRLLLPEVARGPVPWIARATSEARGTGLTVQALLDELRRAAESPPSDTDASAARRRLLDGLGVRLRGPRDIAATLAGAAELRLPDDFADRNASQLRATDGSAVAKALRASTFAGVIVAVAGDAARIAPLLVRLGDVTVTSPERGFERVRTLPADAQAPLEAAPAGAAPAPPPPRPPPAPEPTGSAAPTSAPPAPAPPGPPR